MYVWGVEKDLDGVVLCLAIDGVCGCTGCGWLRLAALAVVYIVPSHRVSRPAHHPDTINQPTQEYATNVAALVDLKLEKAKNYAEQVCVFVYMCACVFDWARWFGGGGSRGVHIHPSTSIDSSIGRATAT